VKPNDTELLKEFISASKEKSAGSIGEFDKEEIQKLRETGIQPRGVGRIGSFLQSNCNVIQCDCSQSGIDLLPVTEALKRYDWFKDYWWKLVPKDKDPFTRETERHLDNGYFIRARKGEKVVYPVQTCLYIRNDRVAQKVHNVIIAEEGSELHVITGCATHPHLTSALHIGISEFFVKKDAKLIFTMVHNWGEEVYVRPRTGIEVEEDGVFICNYICLKGVKSVQMYPVATLKGKGGLARFYSVVVAPEGSSLDIGSKVVLEAQDTRAEIVSRSVSNGGTIIARGHLVGKAKGAKAHLECQGMILSKKGTIHAIPELEARLDDVDMSHEAAVGKIAQDQIEYLMARGLSEEDAVATIVRGFLDVKIEGLPPELEEELQRAVSECQHGM